MFVLAGSSQINLDNVEKFDIIAKADHLCELHVRFVSGTTKILCSGTPEQCAQYLSTIMISKSLREKKQ